MNRLFSSLECCNWHGKQELRSQLKFVFFYRGVVHLGDVVRKWNLKGCQTLKIPKYGFAFSQFTELFGRNYKIYRCCMNLCHWKHMLHLGWIGRYRMVHTWYKSPQIYYIIMQWRHYLGYHLKQKRYRMYASRMQGGRKYYNVVGVPIGHFVQRYSYRESWLVGSH